MVARLKPKKKETSKQLTPMASSGHLKRIKPDPNKAGKVQAKEQHQAQFRYNQFIRYYLETKGNATRAAILAGYDAKNAAVQGSQLLKLPYIKEKIQFALARLQERTDISLEKLVIELAKLGMSNMQDYTRINEHGEPVIDLSDLDESQWSAIQEVQTEVEMRGPPDDQYPVKKVKIKLYSKTDALDKIARILGGYNGKRGGNGEPAPDSPDGQQVTTHYTLQIGNATINVGGKAGEGSGTEGADSKILTLP